MNTSMNSTEQFMKAIAFEKFGDVGELGVRSVPVPKVGDDEVLIRVHNTSVNPVDWKIRRGYLKDLLPHIFPVIPGWDAAGVVEQVGINVSTFEVGDFVAGYTRLPEVHHGTYAELISVPASFLAKIPKGLSLEQAAGVPLVALTAWQALTDYSTIEPGQNILILNGAGGVGSFAIQFAKQLGAIVTTTTSTRNQSYVKSLGADHVIDYSEEDVSKEARVIAPSGFDFIFDGIGGDNLKHAYNLVKAEGKLVSIVDQPDPHATQSYKANFHFVYPNGEQLKKIFESIDSHKIQLPNFKVMPISAAREAHTESESHRTRGKIVLSVAF